MSKIIFFEHATVIDQDENFGAVLERMAAAFAAQGFPPPTSFRVDQMPGKRWSWQIYARGEKAA